jgi:hypothetical protein
MKSEKMRIEAADSMMYEETEAVLETARNRDHKTY